jgi:M6 family metalloprotease-like protein
MMKKLIAALLAAVLLGLVPAAQADAKAFKNCTDLRKVYKYGISLSTTVANRGAGPIFTPRASAPVYKLNTRLDFDADKIVCEVLKPKVQKPTTPASTPRPTESSEAYTPPSSESDPIEVCRIKEVSRSRGMTGAGFPEWNSLTPRSGVVRWALIPIDFPDLPGEKNFRPRVDEQMKLLSEWFLTVSGGKFKVEWVVLNEWATLPGKAAEYVIPASVNVDKAANGPKLFKDAMTAADPKFDFTNVQTVNFILPSGQSFLTETSQGFPWDQVVRDYKTKEGSIDSYSIAGQFFDLPGKAYWSYWAHEFGHAIGLPHVGSSRGEQPPFSPWDLMGSQDGPARELSGWLRFFAGWLQDEQVFCKDSNSINKLKLTLVPLSSPEQGIKFVVIPLSKTKALLIESRRETKFSCSTNPARDGVLVYVYDATLGHGENFLIPISPPGRENQRDTCSALHGRTPPNPDRLLRQGESVVIEGLTVEVVNHGVYDQVLVSRK